MLKKVGAGMLALIALLFAVNFATRDAGANMREISFNRYSLGVATIGPAGESSGTFNVDSFSGNPAAAIRAAMAVSSEIRFLKGTYTFSEPFKSGVSGLTISADPGTVFTSSGSNAVAFLDLTGADVTVRGIHFAWSTWVDDQIAVKFSSPSTPLCARAKLLDCKFSVTPSVGFVTDLDTAHPMIFAMFDTVVAKWVERCMFFPQGGVTCVKTSNGNGLRFLNSEISNWSDGGFPELAVFADMYRGVDMVGEEWALIQNSKFWAVGNYTLYGSIPALEPDACIRYDGSTTGNEEFGHLVITGCIIENVNTPRPIYLISPQWFNLSGNLIGPNFAAVSTDGEAAIKILGSNASAVTVTAIETDADAEGSNLITFSANPNLSTGESFYLATTGLTNTLNARTYTASAASTGSGPYTVVPVEDPAADETGLTATAYVATSGSIGPKKAWAGLIAANDIHNSAGQGTAGCALWIEHADKITVSGNNINLQRGLKMGRIDTATCMDVSVLANAHSFFENAALNPTSAWVLPNGVANRLAFSGNTYVGDPTFISGSVTGSYWFPNGIQEITADGGGDTTLTPESADTAEQLTTNLNLNNG